MSIYFTVRMDKGCRKQSMSGHMILRRQETEKDRINGEERTKVYQNQRSM